MIENRNTKKNKYVWYVSYGSNMLQERFMCDIAGGSYRGSAYHEPCSNPAAPKAVRTYEIPHDMYFGNTSFSWGGKGVSFIDITKPGKAKGVAYLITLEQFEHVAREENGGTAPGMATNWYNTVVHLGTLDGIEVLTITNNECRPTNAPGEAYLETLAGGLRENYPEMSETEIQEYLMSCIRWAGRNSRGLEQ